MKTKHLICRLSSWFVLAATSALVTAPLAHAADYQTTVLGDSPLAFYPLNLAVDTSGTATDVSGNGNNGSYVNISSGSNNTNGPSAFITNAVYFDGLGTSVDLSSAPSLAFSGPASLEAWVQPANSTSFGDIIGKGYDSSTYQETFVRVNGPYGADYVANLGNAGVSGGQQNTNWVHLVISNDGATTTFYLNGILIQSVADTTGAINFSDPWAIGNGTSAGNGRHFYGNISQVAIYAHGLTRAQILNHYFEGLVGNAADSSAPIINVQPQPQSTYVGGKATFSVTAVSSLPMTNQWFKAGVALPGQTNSTLTLTGVSSGDAVNYSVVVGNSNGTTNSVPAALTLLTPGNSLEWSANANSGVWDTGSSANWINLSNSSQTVFNTSDQVFFDDTVGVPTTVTINGTVSPSIITVNSSANNFTFTNTSGTINGPGSLVKQGASTLLLQTGFNLTGPVLISGGTVVAGNNAFNSVASVTVTNNSAMDFGGSSLTGNKPITISGTGVGGNGAIFNSGGAQYGQVLNISLAGDATIGQAGNNRWDLANGSQITGPHNLTVNWNGNYGEWNSVLIGADVPGIELRSGTLGLKYMDTFQNPATVITVDSNCELPLWNGGLSSSLHVMSNGRVDLWQAPAPLTGSTVTLEDGALWYGWGSSSSDQAINCAMVLNGVAHFIIGDHNMVYTNLVSGPGGFVVDVYNHQIVFASSNTYTGPTIINDGPQVALVGDGSISKSSLIFFGGRNLASFHLDASQRTDSTFTLASGQTLGGVGVVVGNLAVSAGATIAPAGTNTTLGITTGTNQIGLLSATADVTLNGTTVLKLDGSGVNDSLSAGGNLVCGGVLNLTNISGTALAAGDSFQIFTAGGAISGGFSSITPATPGPGLAWDTNQLSSGLVSVVSVNVPTITTVQLSAGNVILGGSGGGNNATFYLLTTTNLLTPLANWTVLSTNNYDASGNFSVTNPIVPGIPQRFYRIKQ